MSELIKHECGIAMIRLLKPFEYYQQKYGSWDWALKKLYLLMEKQHNRGQDGAGLITFKLNSLPGKEYIHRVRSNASEPIKDVFKQIDKQRSTFLADKENLSDQLKKDLDIINEIAKSLDLELVCVASETVSENEFSLDFKKLGINALSIYVEKLITREIFEKICSLKKLEVLIIEYSYSVIEKLQSQNEVVILPDCLQNLSDLKVLELYGFRIRDIPNWITKLTKLEEFACSNHLLKNIPPVLFSLKHLTNIFFYPGISRQN